MATLTNNQFEQTFDAKFAADLLLDIAQERSLESLMEKFIRVALARPGNARVEFWLIEAEETSSGQNSEGQSLHLVASGSSPVSGIEDDKVFDRNSKLRIPLGVGVIGKIAGTGQQTILRDLDRQPGEFSGLDWLQREQIRGFAGTAITFKGEIRPLSHRNSDIALHPSLWQSGSGVEREPL